MLEGTLGAEWIKVWKKWMWTWIRKLNFLIQVIQVHAMLLRTCLNESVAALSSSLNAKAFRETCCSHPEGLRELLWPPKALTQIRVSLSTRLLALPLRTRLNRHVLAALSAECISFSVCRILEHLRTQSSYYVANRPPSENNCLSRFLLIFQKTHKKWTVRFMIITKSCPNG